MTRFNNQGFVVKRPDGRLLADSHLSAYSSRVARTNSVLEPVPDAPGLHVRVATREVAQVTGSQRAEVHARAREWLAAQPEELQAAVAFATPETGDSFGEAEANWSDRTADTSPNIEDQVALDAISLEDLKERARELDIPGRSKMDKAALFEAVQAAVANATPDEE